MTDQHPLEKRNGPNMPASVTPYGAIAYRLDALANSIYLTGEIDIAAQCWGIMDDLVALNQAAPND